MSDSDIEKKIQEKGLTAPRITPEHINKVIIKEEYQVFPSSQLTVCCLTLVNGFTVSGESACVSPANFNAEIGREIAYGNAAAKIGMLEGYLLKQRIHDQEVNANGQIVESVEHHEIINIARICYEVNRAYCESMGDMSQPLWKDAEEWQSESVIKGVTLHLANPDVTPEDSHNGWMEEKEANGWAHGEVKDPEKKLHPCFMPYKDLPQEEKTKDYLFTGVVRAMTAAA